MWSAVGNCMIVVEEEVDLVVAFRHGVDRGRYDVPWCNQLGLGQQINGRLGQSGRCAMDRLGNVIREGARFIVILVDTEPGDGRLRSPQLLAPVDRDGGLPVA